MIRPKNRQRAARINHAIRAYHASEEGLFDTDKAQILSDLLTDMMHWADVHRLDFAARLTNAQYSHKLEKEGRDHDL